MTPEVASKKGMSFVAVKDFVLQQGGPEAWNQVLTTLPTHEAEVVSAAVGVGWYPLSLYAALIRAVDRVQGTGNLTVIPRITRYEAERDLPTVYRLFLRMAHPAFIIEKTGELWRRYHTTGRWKIDRVGEDGVDAALYDWGADEALCVGFIGYCLRALELAGARLVRVEHPMCRARGDSHCLFRARWGSARGG